LHPRRGVTFPFVGTFDGTFREKNIRILYFIGYAGYFSIPVGDQFTISRRSVQNRGDSLRMARRVFCCLKPSQLALTERQGRRVFGGRLWAPAVLVLATHSPDPCGSTSRPACLGVASARSGPAPQLRACASGQGPRTRQRPVSLKRGVLFKAAVSVGELIFIISSWAVSAARSGRGRGVADGA